MKGEILVYEQASSKWLSQKKITHGAAGIGSQKLQRSGIGGGSSNDDGVLHGIRICQTFHDLGNSGSLLTNGNVDAVKFLLLVSSIVETLLVDDGIDGDGRLAENEISNIKLCLDISMLNPGMFTQSDDHQ